MRPRSLLRLEDKLAAEEAHLRALGRGDQRSRLASVLVVSLAAHLAVLLVPAPPAAADPPPSRTRAAFPTVIRWTPGTPASASPPAPPVSATRPPGPRPAAVVAVPRAVERPAGPARIEVFTRSEPVPEPPSRIAASLPRDAEALIGTPAPPPPPPEPVWRAGPAATRPVVAPEGRVEPEYPPAARALRLSGTVLLDVLVNEDGTVGAVTVVGVSRRGVGFEDAAVAAIRRWRFVPATHDGRPVAATTPVEVAFQ